ncbi:hypothetical protein REPUB_Repub06bG0120800 [Reevesia pubescens]
MEMKYLTLKVLPLPPADLPRKQCHATCDNDTLAKLENCFIGKFHGALNSECLVENFKSEGIDDVSIKIMHRNQGDFIGTNGKTLSLEDFSFGAVLVSANDIHKIEKIVELIWDNEIFMVRVLEHDNDSISVLNYPRDSSYFDFSRVFHFYPYHPSANLGLLDNSHPKAPIWILSCGPSPESDCLKLSFVSSTGPIHYPLLVSPDPSSNISFPNPLIDNTIPNFIVSSSGALPCIVLSTSHHVFFIAHPSSPVKPTDPFTLKHISTFGNRKFDPSLISKKNTFLT